MLQAGCAYSHQGQTLPGVDFNTVLIAVAEDHCCFMSIDRFQ